MPIKDAVEKELARKSSVSIINLVDRLIERGEASRASDIHLDPTSTGLRIRFRVDGALEDAYALPKSVQMEIVSRVKVLASLRTDEHQAAQDGRFRHSVQGKDPIDIRVSIAPAYHGESVVLRLLAEHAEAFTLTSLGFGEGDRRKIEKALERQNGMILATGPTGSGKTTTLYTLIKMLNAPGISIVTIEDPIEYAVAGVEQIQVNPHTGLSFANGLRTILRQDPNVIMVGEIRDAETAGIAVNTALTGHLLLSTLHTSDASTTLPRLLDMKIEPYLVASTVNVTIAQRLVRKICAVCKEEEKATPALSASLSGLALGKPVRAGQAFYRGAGCPECRGSGYRGRTSVNEVLVADTEIREAIMRKASASELRRLAVGKGMTTMLEDGFAKARAGTTSIEEVLRVTHE